MKHFVGCVSVLLLLLGFIAPAFGQQQELVGAGATFPYPLYSKMFDVYAKEYGVRVNYQSIGSGGGQQQLKSRTVDFGASDAFLSDEQMKAFAAPVVHVPVVAGA